MTAGASIRTPIALTIAGSDSSGGAGIQADLKTFSVFGVYGASVITALTAQNTRGVQGIHPVPAAFVAAQMTSVFSDLDVSAVKTGMLADAEVVRTVAQGLRAVRKCPVVVDPVMVATSGDVLLAPDAVAAVIGDLIPAATLITPNLAEAARLLGASAARTMAEAEEQARALRALGCGAVLVKGGHGAGETAIDILYDGEQSHRFERPRIDTPHTHGTGCSLSAAIAALLAQGVALTEAVDRAKAYVWEGLRHGRTLGIGHGTGPIDHLFGVRAKPPA
ncbi:MAG TPA: bifunctional hydroxymethylpyrimidine kinase/phosphomethylpyrimidine kinase [Hyphomicrobiaceae bacterium]|nr:bifunctional hydroxymethylpyrimidine kinase/phosphomethylpyrimidine kinase [Hyphomicrobiaceae bacterium]